MGGRVWQFLFLTLALALRAVRQTEVKKQVSSLRLDTVQTKTTLTAEDAIVRINQRIFRYEKPWRSFLIEGDIIKPLWKNAVVSETKIWQKSPDGVVRIPYEISQKYDEETRSSISRGFKDFEKFTCVRFAPHSDEEDFISIQPIHGCYSSVGRIGGMQLISLNHQCLKKGKGVVEHEIMHSLGFWHEHARSDRDKFIKIEWKNVWPGYEHNFLKQNTNNLKTKYDYGSILHYSRTAFSKNREPTLRPLMDTDTVLGQRIRLSELDLVKVNRLYNCTTHLKDKANVVKRLQMLNEDGSLHELGRAKEAGRLKFLLGIYPETVKVRVDTSAQLIWSLSGNGSTGNHTTTTTHGYRECFRQGHYLYLEASYPRQSGEHAALVSPVLRGQKCLTFWFNMFGSHMGSLNVFQKSENAPHWHKLWSVSGNKGRKWLNAEIDLFPHGETYQVIIEGVLGPNYQSDAAIDDVQIHRSSCTSGWERRNPSCNWGRKKRNKSHLG
ncbi:meprin A subunit beta-like isoform X3 [Scyliorhinus canicula]|uniref:meprin A subunit beta-like isoform X3 n=1 Tax=Scyliorhinus canicula TaxID=7830 RepID=UPI0018F704B5|nr:meprin A subunit beta-like isoform X3 [Scyliorhinus canicula]